jgi:hypothetical protein
MNRIAIVAFCSLLTAQQPAAHNLQGAVRVVDVRGRAIEVTTGVGLALRVVRLQVPSDARVSAAGAGGGAGTALPLGQLRPGDIVRVSYGTGRGGVGYVAYTIERVGRMATGLSGGPSR